MWQKEIDSALELSENTSIYLDILGRICIHMYPAMLRMCRSRITAGGLVSLLSRDQVHTISLLARSCAPRWSAPGSGSGILRRCLVTEISSASKVSPTVDKTASAPRYLAVDHVVTLKAKGAETTGGDAITFGFGAIGNQADSSVVGSQGGTVVHAAVSINRKYSATDSFMPLTVDYRDRMYARGLVPVKLHDLRERHGTDDEILVGRMIDRALRPLFAPGYVDELQIMVTNHSADGKADPTILALNAASCALMQTKAPWSGPVGCVRIGMVDGFLKVNPTIEEMKRSTLDLVYAGTAERPTMIEASAKEIPDREMKQAIRLAHRAIQPIIAAQQKLYGKFETLAVQEAEAAAKLIAASGLPPLSTNSNGPLSPMSKFSPQLTVKPELLASAREIGYEAAVEVFRASLPRAERSRREGTVRYNLITSLKAMEQYAKEPDASFQMAAEEVMSSAFKTVVFEGRRVDGREWNELREITCNADVLPMPHGSSFFQRGNTHVLCTTTLGSLIDSKMNHQINGAPDETRKRFVLHYDFPPYCTGEIDSVRVNRRMIGHGALAEKGVRAVMPSEDDFPYLVRVYSECTSSNGSSSMASVCGASLALMDAGVPIKKPVAGLSVGLVTRDPSVTSKPKERKRGRKRIPKPDPTAPWVVLTDILGLEDHYGDMDFKIAGTADGITAMQLDIKLLNGVPMEALEEAISASRTARLKILHRMNNTLSMPRYALKPHSPVAAIVRFNPERRRYLLGAGGEMMRYIRTKYDCELEIEDELNETVNTAYIYGNNAQLVNEAKSLVQDLVLSVSVGEVCSAVVSEIKDFGATVKITRSQEALLHISELTHDPVLKRKPLSELIAVGQSFPVEIISVNNTTGQVRVSRRKLLPLPTDGSTPVDNLQPQPASSRLLEPIPEFPVIPPRKYSKDFFSENVVKLPPAPKPSPSSPNASVAPKAGAAVDASHSVQSEDLDALESDFFAEVLNGKKREELKGNGKPSSGGSAEKSRKGAGAGAVQSAPSHGRHKVPAAHPNHNDNRRNERHIKGRHPSGASDSGSNKAGPGSRNSRDNNRDRRGTNVSGKDKISEPEAKVSVPSDAPPSALAIARQRALLESMEKEARKASAPSTGEDVKSNSSSESPKSESQSKSDSRQRQRQKQKPVRSKGDKIESSSSDGAKALTSTKEEKNNSAPESASSSSTQSSPAVVSAPSDSKDSSAGEAPIA